MGIKVILDTDIGNDIDDALCAGYLLANRECELLGVTTVFGDTVVKARLISALCKAAQRDVPIYPGVKQPLLVPIREGKKTSRQAAALPELEHDTDWPEREAMRFLSETIRANPGEVVLCTIGALTNIGVLFSIDPELPALLKGMVSFCGHYGVRKPEPNAFYDPHAAAIVYGQRMNYHKCMGHDVNRYSLHKSVFGDKFSGHPVLDVVRRYAEIYFERQDTAYFADPLAGIAIFREDIFGWKKGRATIELKDEEMLGLTHWAEGGEEPWHEVPFEIDRDAFEKEYFSVFEAR